METLLQTWDEVIGIRNTFSFLMAIPAVFMLISNIRSRIAGRQAKTELARARMENGILTAQLDQQKKLLTATRLAYRLKDEKAEMQGRMKNGYVEFDVTESVLATQQQLALLAHDLDPTQDVKTFIAGLILPPLLPKPRASTCG